MRQTIFPQRHTVGCCLLAVVVRERDGCCCVTHLLTAVAASSRSRCQPAPAALSAPSYLVSVFLSSRWRDRADWVYWGGDRNCKENGMGWAWQGIGDDGPAEQKKINRTSVPPKRPTTPKIQIYGNGFVRSAFCRKSSRQPGRCRRAAYLGVYAER